MSIVSTPIQRGRILQQVLPQAGATYDQIYMNQLVTAMNNFMNQSAAPGDSTSPASSTRSTAIPMAASSS